MTDDSGVVSGYVSQTESVTSRNYSFRDIRGRKSYNSGFFFLIYICRYHGIPDNPYPYPSDEDEAERLDVMQWVLRIYYNGNIKIPLCAAADQIYDIGSGSGCLLYLYIFS